MAEDQGVKMGATVFVAVFSAAEESNQFRFELLAEFFHKELERTFVGRVRIGQIFISIGQRDEVVLLMHLRFVFASNGPVSGLVDSATDTAIAGEVDRPSAIESVFWIENQNGLPALRMLRRRAVGLYWVVAGQSLIPPLMGAATVFLGWVDLAVLVNSFFEWALPIFERRM